QFEPGIFDPIIESIRNPYDPWMTAADFRGYLDSQEQAAMAYQDQKHWTRMSIFNSAKSGRFSTDRTIQEYNRDVWKLKPVVAPSVNESGQ
ncbi:MAG: glycogen/starch/alpha-glucan phosphorylase, partial [Candidatus Thiodiazotropha sp. (ex Lucinoma borealis)]|nr:glycogen/starch/alpha-glucan phosphorylase [Candidatus Thiodiazotropha sp. (ex Lucinoma borealis)]